jgi:hypothetical protein
MADQLSLRGGTTAEHATFTGANKEVTVDTTKKTLVVNDGATVGGHPLMRENASNSALALGSAATPSLKFTGDTNTGIYSPGADQVAVATNGTGRLFINTATAQYGIRVTGGGYNNSTNVYGVHSALAQQNLSPTYGGYFSAAGTYVAMYGIYGEATNNDSNPANNVYAGYFKTNGSAGGTGGTNYGIRVENAATNGGTSYGAYLSTVAGASTVIPLRIDHAGSEKLRIDSSGRLLVGTSTATGANLLQVNSDALVNGITVGRGLTLITSNTAVGQALYFNNTGSSNTAIGSAAGYAINTGAGNISIGGLTSAGATSPVFATGSENNRISMGSTAVTNAYIQVAWTVVSDARDKTNFAPVPHGLDFVNALKPTAFQFKLDRESDQANGPVRYGFKAQDILELEGENSIIIDSVNPDKLYYNGESLIPVLVNAIKELSAKNTALEARLTAAGID